MHPEIAMHLCALVEDEDRRVYISFFFCLSSLSRRARSCSLLFSSFPFSNPLHRLILFPCSFYHRFSSLSSFLAKTVSLRHSAYIAEECIIIRKMSVRFLWGANKMSLRVRRIRYRPSCALYTRIPIRFKARTWLCVCTYACMSDGRT